MKILLHRGIDEKELIIEFSDGGAIYMYLSGDIYAYSQSFRSLSTHGDLFKSHDLERYNPSIYEKLLNFYPHLESIYGSKIGEYKL